ncbi:MAG TPA: cytochrome c, partial [Flavobacteriales bacterium]|nr:cytochrome c [Flavobacteriales bacterium]
MKTLITFLILSLLMAALFMVGCGDNTREEKEKQYTEGEGPKRISVANGVCLSPDEFHGMKLFMRYCNKCHPGGEEGKGPELNDKNLPDVIVRLQVRLGGGKMPKFKKDQLPRPELDRIVE